METTIVKEDFIKEALQKYNITDGIIKEMEQKFMPLKIKGVTDLEGYKKVREARLFIKDKRIEVEKKRKELKEDSLRFGRAVDTEAKRITSLLSPIEDHLDSQEKWVDSELIRIKFEKEQKEKLPSRIEKLESINASITETELLKLDDFGFNILFNDLHEKYLEEKETQMRAEQEGIREEQEKKEAQMRAEQERIDVENRAIEDKKRADQEKIEAEKRKIEEAKQMAIEIEQVKKEAAKRAKIEAELKIKQEAKEKIEKERLAKLEAERQEVLRPDKEKLLSLAKDIDDFKLPNVKSVEVLGILADVKKLLRKVSTFLREKSKSI